MNWSAMLQFSSVVCNVSSKFTSRLYWRFTASFATNSTVVSNESANMAIKENHKSTMAKSMDEEQRKRFNDLKLTVYYSLHEHSALAQQIQHVQNVQELLSLIKGPEFSQKDVANIINTIVSWVQTNNPTTTAVHEETENPEDKPKKMPQLVVNKNKNIESVSVYSDLSTSAMVKEISQLAAQNERDLKSLRFLFDSIRQYNKELQLKQCSSLLFSMCKLSYSDEKLLKKICSNLISMSKWENINTLSSIVKSMAILRFKNKEFLDYICNVLVNSDCSAHCKQIASILFSCALLGYSPSKLKEVIVKYAPHLTFEKLGYNNWLNLVWCLVVLDNVQPEHLTSVLNEKFVNNILVKVSEADVLKHLKLLNINAAAQYIVPNYSGPLLDETQLPSTVLQRSKQKSLYVSAVEETLRLLSKSSSSFKMDINTKMGFLLDAECYVNSKFEIISYTDTNPNELHKVGIMIHDYNDYCMESNELLGIHKLCNKLLIASGYNVLNISYKHFGIEDVSTKRLEYLKRRIRSLKVDTI